MKKLTILFALILVSIYGLKAQLAWPTNGTSIYFNGGNVGIGTLNPLSKLHISDNVQGNTTLIVEGGSNNVDYLSSRILLRSPNTYRGNGIHTSTGGAINWFFGNPYSSNDNFIISRLAGSESNAVAQISNALLTISSNGNVGIGTTIPSTKLDVRGSYITTRNSDSYSPAFMEGGASNVCFGSTGAVPIHIGNVTNYSRLVILNNGNVGIGTISPNAKLNVQGDISLGGGWDRGFNIIQSSMSLGETESGAATILGNNIKVTDNVNNTLEVLRSASDGSSWFRISYFHGFSFHRIGATPVGTKLSENSGELFRITPTGNVGIGITNPQYKLAVEGTIAAREIKVTAEVWSDFVFHPTYKLRTLGEVEQFIKTNNHLPEIPTEAEVKENGIGLGEMNAKLLQKIEELTLYMIEIKKENEKQKLENHVLIDRIKKIEEKLN